MTLIARRLSVVLVLVLVVAVVARPLIADYCADACEHAGDASAGATAAACHHTRAAPSRIGPAPAPCGHGHQATLIAAPSIGPSIRALINSLAVLPASVVVNAAVSRDASIAAPELPPDRASHAAPSPLRI